MCINHYRWNSARKIDQSEQASFDNMIFGIKIENFHRIFGQNCATMFPFLLLEKTRPIRYIWVFLFDILILLQQLEIWVLNLVQTQNVGVQFHKQCVHLILKPRFRVKDVVDDPVWILDENVVRRDFIGLSLRIISQHFYFFI